MEQMFEENQSEDNKQFWHLVQSKLLLHLRNEDIFFLKKARVKFLRDADQNKKFFHATPVQKSAKLTIHRIKNRADSWLGNKDDIKLEAEDFFSILLMDEMIQMSDMEHLFDFIPQLIIDLHNTCLLALLQRMRFNQQFFQIT
ncbi:hypothetical protein ACH5RR_001326 [Cinchona calisaya]|uniref:Uncharacterized protein n=1 Tax=Cinchona calisaya TaxID=153742 RepID=A0ABD3B333_9GENT